MAEGVVIDAELRWPPKRRSMGSKRDTPKRKRVAGLDISVEGKRDAKEAKFKYSVVGGD